MTRTLRVRILAAATGVVREEPRHPFSSKGASGSTRQLLLSNPVRNVAQSSPDLRRNSHSPGSSKPFTSPAESHDSLVISVWSRRYCTPSLERPWATPAGTRRRTPRQIDMDWIAPATLFRSSLNTRQTFLFYKYVNTTREKTSQTRRPENEPQDSIVFFSITACWENNGCSRCDVQRNFKKYSSCQDDLLQRLLFEAERGGNTFGFCFIGRLLRNFSNA